MYEDIKIYYGFKGLDSRFKWFDTFNINEGDVVFDCGSYYGSNTIYLSRRVGTSGRVISIEADPISYKYLRKAIKDFNLNNVTIINRAITNYTGNGYIYTSMDGTSANSIIKESRKITTTDKKKVHCDTFRNILKLNSINKIKFIYLNIEGSEYDILDDIDYISSTYKPIWCIHDHSKYLQNRQSSELEDVIIKNKYKIIYQPYKSFIPLEDIND